MLFTEKQLRGGAGEMPDASNHFHEVDFLVSPSSSRPASFI